MEAKVEKFLLENPGLDERAVKALRSATPDIQGVVMERGNLLDCNNPTAVLMSRIRRENETSLSGVSKADLHGTPEEAWARICARSNIKAPTQQASSVAQPSLLAAIQLQQQQQQQLAAQQQAAYLHALYMQQLASMQQLPSMQALAAPQLPLASLAQLGGIAPAPPAVPPAPALAMPSAAAPLAIPQADLSLSAAGMQQLAAQPQLAAMWQQSLLPLAAAVQESGPGGAFAGAADAPAQLAAGFVPAAACGAAGAAAAPQAPAGGAADALAQLAAGFVPAAEGGGIPASFGKGAPASAAGGGGARSAPY